MEIDISLFKRGYNNAITREELMNITGKDDRSVRLGIRNLIDKGYVIMSSSNTKGYWLPDSYDEIELYISQLEHRAKECMKRAKSAKKIYKNRYQFGLGIVC